jgi:hypothetical protein
MAQRAGFFPSGWRSGLGLCSLVILGQAVWHAAPALRRPLVGVRRVGTTVDRSPYQPSPWSHSLKVLASTRNCPLPGLLHAMGGSASLAPDSGGEHLSAARELFLFDKWFLIPMPKGLWGEHLGL